MTSAEYKKLSSEQLCMLWLSQTERKSFTHSEVEDACQRFYWHVNIHRLGSTYKRAMQRLMEHNKLGPITTKQITQDGQTWTRYSFLRKNMVDWRKLGSMSHGSPWVPLDSQTARRLRSRG